MQNVLHFPPGMKLADLQDDFGREDLIYFTNSMIDSILEMVRDVPDNFVTFTPTDPEADDPWAATEGEKTIPWTLGHVIVHTTASAEERTSHGSMLARGTQIKGRNRYEIPWETITTNAQIIHRLEESRRMRLAFLDTWPDPPLLDNVYDQKSYVDAYGPLNAIGMTLMGLKHEAEHLPQIQEIVRQAQDACVAC